MKIPALATALVLSIGAAAQAQETRNHDPLPSFLREEDTSSRIARILDSAEVASALPSKLSWEPGAPAWEHESAGIPMSLASEAFQAEPAWTPFSIGPVGGYLVVKDADHGTWFGGVQARLRFGMFAVEGSITAHQNEYEDGDVIVTQYPVQVTAFLYIIPAGPVRPYILGGVGWYYTRVDYKGVFSSLDDHTEHIFGEHLGAGVELLLGPRVSIDADLRYIFLNPDTDQVISRDFNYWQVTLGVNVFF